MSHWFVYMIQCRDKSLYTGITTDVQRRLAEHRQGGPRAAKYLRGRGPLTLVFSCLAASRSEALRLELKIKALSKANKLHFVGNTLVWNGRVFLPSQKAEHVS